MAAAVHTKFCDGAWITVIAHYIGVFALRVDAAVDCARVEIVALDVSAALGAGLCAGAARQYAVSIDAVEAARAVRCDIATENTERIAAYRLTAGGAYAVLITCAWRTEDVIRWNTLGLRCLDKFRVTLVYNACWRIGY